MKNKTIYQVMIASLASFAMFGYAQAQTATTSVPVTEFKKELADGMKNIANDPEAKRIQREIKGDDREVAGDTHGDAKEIEGENDQNEIDNEIEQEVETEGSSEATTEGTSERGASETGDTSSEGN